MTVLQVAHLDGAYHLIRPNGKIDAIRLRGEPVRNFHPGWTPRLANIAFDGLVMLDMMHESGDEATWILDSTLEHRGSRLADLSVDAQSVVANDVASAMRAIYQAVVCDPVPRRPAELELFRGLNPGMIASMLDVAMAQALGETQVIDLFNAQSNTLVHDVEMPHGSSVTLSAVQQCLSGNFQDALADALSSGSISCPSPVDGHLLQSRDSLVLHEHRIAYRFVDHRYGLVFFVGTTHFHFAKADLFIPFANVAFKQHIETASSLTGLARLFIGHVLQEANSLLTYLESPYRHFTAACRGIYHLHVGHHLWNELTGLDRLVRTVKQDDLPMVIAPDAEEGSEVFAPLDRIFPELSGRIDRRLHGSQTLSSFVYNNSYCLIRVLDDHVTLSLSKRIRRAAAMERPTEYDLSLAARLIAGKTPCILLGVRIENRTAVDLESLLTDMIVHLQRRLGRVAIVLDGHNARVGHDPVTSFGSFGQQGEHPVFGELRLAQRLQGRFSGSSVRFINLFGAAMSRSLFWTQHSSFFIAFWGAGLAKYRWACNRPGLVLSSAWNLCHRGDLEIYHAPRYQEAGAGIRFIEAVHVTDDHAAPLMFSPINPIPSYSNFDIAREPLLHELDVMIADCLPTAS